MHPPESPIGSESSGCVTGGNPVMRVVRPLQIQNEIQSGDGTTGLELMEFDGGQTMSGLASISRVVCFGRLVSTAARLGNASQG